MEKEQVKEMFERLNLDTELKRKSYIVQPEGNRKYVNEIKLDNVSS